jgi:hypothetical protein
MEKEKEGAVLEHMDLLEFAFTALTLRMELGKTRGTMTVGKVAEAEQRISELIDRLARETRRRVVFLYPEWAGNPDAVEEEVRLRLKLYFEQATDLIEGDIDADINRNAVLHSSGGEPARRAVAEASLLNNDRRVAAAGGAGGAGAAGGAGGAAGGAGGAAGAVAGGAAPVAPSAEEGKGVAWAALNAVSNRNNRRRRLTRKRNSRASRTYRSRR